MAEPIRFFFDFVSPFGYFAAARIEALAERVGRATQWHAFNMRSVNATHLGVERAIFELPLKGPYFAQDVPRMARWFGLPFAPGDVASFNPVAAERAFWRLHDADAAQAKAFAVRVFQRFHAEGVAPNDPAEVAALAADFGAPADLEDWLRSEDARARLKAETAAAVAEGVWGTPTFKVGDQLFWGADRMAMLEDWIARGGW